MRQCVFCHIPAAPFTMLLFPVTTFVRQLLYLKVAYGRFPDVRVLGGQGLACLPTLLSSEWHVSAGARRSMIVAAKL